MENSLGQPETVIVLGGSSDIARAVTRKLCAARAHTVVLAGRNQNLLDAAAQEAREYGCTTTDTVLFDARDIATAKASVSEAFEKIGGQVDLVVVAVGILGDPYAVIDDAEAAGLMATVNFVWPVAALAEVRRRLVSQGAGRILVMSSVAAVRVRRIAYLYDGAKAGLDRLCDGLADSLEGTGVTLQLLRPGYVRSKMTAGTPERPFTTGVDEVADNVMKGLSSDERVIWSPPILRYVFFALRHLPAPLWRKVMSN
jgi:decaprenylphospho-beta-D-erythro-pentofuranosid-2-ulose 2-reductase